MARVVSPLAAGAAGRLLADLIAFDRVCCPFLKLELAAEPGHGPVWLKLRGPDGTKRFLARSFALCAER